MEQWKLSTRVDVDLEDELGGRLVDFNTSRSSAVRQRFSPGNLASEPLHACLTDEGAGLGVGSALLRSVEDQARALGCRWADVTTFDFQAPEFYRRAGYEQYGVKRDYPPGHANHFLRKVL